MKIAHYSTSGTKGEMTWPAFLGSEVNSDVLAQAIRVYLSNMRQGTSKVKTRSEVNRTKKKWFKQKGTGNARHGARTPSLFVGGGVSHGPNGMQNWVLSLPQRMKHQALMSALVAQAENVIVHDGLNELAGKAKSGATLLKSVVPDGAKVLVIIDQTQPVVIRSLQNIDGVLVMTASRVTALEVAAASAIILTSQSLAVLEARLAGSVTKKSAAEEVVAKKVAKPAKSVDTKSTIKKPAAKKAVKAAK